MTTALSTAPSAYGLKGPSAAITVDNATPQGATYLRGNTVQTNGTSSIAPPACAVCAVAPVSNILRRLFPCSIIAGQHKRFKYNRAESISKAGARKSELLKSATTRPWPSGNLRQQRTYCCPSSRACFRLEGGQGVHIHVAESSFLNDWHLPLAIKYEIL